MDDKMIRLGNFELLQAMYDFKATFAKTLSFRENDFFILHQTNTKQRNWWQVINDKGQMGFVPSNYVNSVKVAPAFYVQFVDDCILAISRSGSMTADKEDLILRLNEKKRQTELSCQMGERGSQQSEESGTNSYTESTLHFPNGEDIRVKISNPVISPARRTETRYSKNNEVIEEPIKPIQKQISDKEIKHSIENIHVELLNEQKFNSLPNQHKSDIETKKSSSNTSVKSSKSLKLVDISPQAVYELVETVRINTQLSHEMSKVAVATVVTKLKELLPSTVHPSLSSILSYTEDRLVMPEDHIDQTHDAHRLNVIFNELISCKEDSQQRSWMLYEDEGVIKDYISELISILSNADASISRHIVRADQYNVIVCLIQYYQMEVRWSIRQLLLQAFGILCSLDRNVVSIMLNSVLPMELARDMKANSRNIPKLNYSGLLLTMIFSLGEQMPITHLEHLGYDFITFVISLIESPPETDIEEQIPDLFLNLILAYNLQFTTIPDNIVLNVLAEQKVAKTFTEKILLLLNREEDPVRIFDHEPAPPHSLLKLFKDLFSRQSTAALFYTNDTKVLIDIIVRQISDLSPGDMKRHLYLELCRLVMLNTNYSEHQHRKDDILKCFTRIFCEEGDQSQADQKLIRLILNEFPEYFK